MKIKNVKIHLSSDKKSSLKATADVIIRDGFVVKNIPIVAEQDHLHLDFPFTSTATSTFMPFTPPAKNCIEKVVISAYLRVVRTQDSEL